MVGAQVMRLHQADAVGWLAWDYAGRIAGLVVLALIPAARTVAYPQERRRLSLTVTAGGILGVVEFDRIVVGWLRRRVFDLVPGPGLTRVPPLHGGLYLLDMTVGIALVAVSEEVVFRRALPEVLRRARLGEAATVVTASLLFGLYHWSFRPATMIGAAAIGIVFMLFYRRAGVLWPVMVSHYLIDAIAFG